MDAETQRDSKEKEVKNEGNGTDSESSTSGRGTPRVDTPGVMPKYQYGREDLYRVRQSPTASRHSCLSKEFDTPDGVWDPERWHRSFGSPHGSSPLTFTRDGIRRDSTSDRKRPAELDRDLLYKRRPSADPKGRIKEEEDEGLGIVLSPQRRSFGTGCHVTTTRHTGSPTDDRERGRSDRVERRIGSGRIQIDRDRDLGLGGRDLGRDKDRELGRDKDFGRDKDRDRDFGRDKDRDRDFGRDKDRDRDFGRDKDRDRDFGRDKDRDRDFGRDKDRERDFGRGMRRERDPDFGPARDDDRDRRGDRDFRDRDRFERRFDSRNDRFGSNRREYGCGESRYDRDRGGRSGRYRHREEVEPEWYSAGPVSQNDTIELHGFDREEKEDLGAKQPKKSRQQSKMMPLRRPSEDKEEPAEALSQEKERKDRPSSTSGADPLKPSHPPGLPQPSDVPTPGSVDFDFNDFFKNFDSIPGLGELGSLPEPEVGMSGVSGSRFSQWFNPSSEHGTSQSNSRRSSLNDEFSYLADMVGTAGGAKSPTSVLSPPALPGNNRLFSPISTAEERQQQDLLNILHEAKMNVQPLTATGHTGPPNHPNSDPGQQHVAKLDHQFSTMTNMAGMHKPPMPTSGLLASDVERDLKAMLMTGNKMGNMNGNRPAGPAPPPAHIKHWLHHGNSNMRGVNHVNKPRDMPLPGKVTTLVELEANMKEMTMGSNSNNMHHHQHQQHQQQHHQQQHTHQQQQHQALNQLQQELAAAKHQQQQQQQAAALVQKTEANMTAFNRLLGLMKFSGALNETPKMPRKADGRPLSPISVAPLPKDMQNPGHQKDLIQQVLAKQQQLQQRQQQQQQQQQQQLKLKQQQVQQQQQFQEILKYVKQNPTIITKPASPIPPAMAATLQPPASPRCASPAVPSLTVPNPPSPRAPSPIMFGSQPPLHLTAPAPIHPGQSQSSSQNLNTLQVNQGAQSPVMARVPSPQELIVHTQAIMQNALIKKQLEDQKERFLKKQHDTSKTPNPLSIQNQAMALNMVLTQTSQATVTPAFTPTSVIRKMATDKAEKEEKERHQDITPGNQAPFDPYATFGVRREPDLTSFLIKNGASGPTMGMKQEMKQPRALVGGQVGPHSAMTMPVAQQSPTSSQGQGRPIVKAAGPMPINQMTRPNPVGAAKPENFRPIVGGHPGMQQNIDIVKLIEAQRIQQQQQQVQQQRQAALSTANTGVSRAGGGGYGGITERLAPSPTPMVHAGVGPAAANAMLLQRMMNPTRQTPSTRPAGLQQLNQVNQLAAQQAQAVQQRSLDPRLQTAAAAAARASLYSMNAGQRGSNFPNNQLTAAAALNAAATLSRALSPQPQLPQPMVSLANDINGPLSPGGYQRAASPNLSAMLGARRPALDNNLAKFFGADIFKQQMPNMPPLPAQGQRVLTVDEIERWSACATCID